jgi:hypothetical protein
MTHKMKHAPEAKKHVKGSVSESVLNENIISDLRKVPGLIKQAVATLKGEVESGNIDVEELKSDFSKNLSKVKSSDVNESLESLTNLLTESDKILVESKLGKLVGNALKGLGFAGLAAGIPGMMSQIMGYTDWQWTTKLHIALEPFCSSLPSWFGCGAFMFLVIALSIGSILGGVAKSFKHRD